MQTMTYQQQSLHGSTPISPIDFVECKIRNWKTCWGMPLIFWLLRVALLGRGRISVEMDSLLDVWGRIPYTPTTDSLLMIIGTFCFSSALGYDETKFTQRHTHTRIAWEPQYCQSGLDFTEFFYFSTDISETYYMKLVVQKLLM